MVVLRVQPTGMESHVMNNQDCTYKPAIAIKMIATCICLTRE